MAFGHHPLPSPSLCGRVTLSVGVHSVYAPVSKSGGLAGLLRSQGSVHSSAGSSCFLFRDTVYQFQALCFGLSTAPRVFTWVMAPVSAILHALGISMRRYLDTWLVQSSSQEVLLPVLRLCHDFGIVIHPRYSNLIPSQVVQYLWVVIDSNSFRASPSVERISRLQSTAAGISVMRLAYREPVAVASRRSFLASSPSSGRLAFFLSWLTSFLAANWDCGPSSSSSIVSWNHQDLEAPILASMECLRVLQWWLHLPRLSLGVSLHQVSPVLHFWSDASDVGWGAHLDCQVASGLGATRQAALSINARDLLAVQLGLFQFRSALRGRTVAVFCDNTTAVHSLVSSPQHLGSGDLALDGVHLHPPASTVPSGLRQHPNRLPVSPSPATTSRVVYTHDRLSVFEKTVAGSNSFFATSATHRGSIYFSPFRDPRSAGTDAFLQFWDSLQAYAFHPVAVIRVLSRSSGPPRGRNSLLWLSTGLSALGFRTWSSSRWLLQ